MKEYRRAKRVPAKLFANIRSTRDRSMIGRGIVVDVSVLGLAVETEADLTIGEQYTCDVEIPLRLNAKVVRRLLEGKMKRYGLELIGQGFIDKILLKKLLQGPNKTSKV